jgi:hypothetical protein
VATVASEIGRPGKIAPQTPVPTYQERSRMQARVAELRRAFEPQVPVLKDIQEHIAPYRGRFQTENQDQRGKRRGLKVINGVASRTMRILSSGLMAGLSSPGRPWFKLTTPDPDLAEFGPHRVWLDQVARAIRTAFARSNLYNVLPSVYGELGPFGTTALLQKEDSESIFRFYPFTMGSFTIAQDDRLVVDTLCREYNASVRQLVMRFGTEALSQHAMDLWKAGKGETEVSCVHLIRPNHDPKGFGWRAMPFTEEYWERASDRTGALYTSGYHERASFVPRWDVCGDDLWGTGIGHEILGDVKQLQFLERRKEDVIEKHTAPPLEAGVELRGKRISLLAGDTTYTNPGATGGASIRPIVTTHPNAYQVVREDCGEIAQRIRQAGYEDLFLMLANDTRSGITAREVEERHQEKMLVLGPVLERLNEELFDPMIDRSFAIMQRRSLPAWRGMVDGMIPLLPPPPPDLQESQLRVEYTSILAQAAKATNTRGLEAFGMFATGVAQAKMVCEQAGMAEKINWDQLFDEYADAQGLPPECLNDDDTVSDLRMDKAKQAQQQQLMAAAPAVRDMAAAAKDAASIPQDSPLAQSINQAMPGVTGG